MVEYFIQKKSEVITDTEFNCITNNLCWNVLYKGDAYISDKISIIIDGYVLPRQSIYDKYKDVDVFQMLSDLVRKYDKDFVKYIKGFFSLVIIREADVILANDIYSVKRYYKYQKEDCFIISNTIGNITREIQLEPNPFAPVMMAFFQHFVDGYTPFVDLLYSLPSSLLVLNCSSTNETQYLSNDYLLNLNKESCDSKIEDFERMFLMSIKQSVEYLKPRHLSTTLTGGRDTRTILSALKKLNHNPHCFTFGYPSGTDVLTSQGIASQCNLSFSNHYIEDVNEKKYSDLVDRVLEMNNPFVHIHRAHRLDAIEKEKECLGEGSSMVFVGAMGGDYIMGEHFNDYILTEFLRRYLVGNEDEAILFKDICKKHFIESSKENILFVKKILKNLSLSHNVFDKNTEFNLVHNIIACTHDMQDINVFFSKMDYVVAPFMDIDVLEVLFSSKMSLFHNNRHTKNPFKRLRGGELQCSLISKYSPQMAAIPFANQYTPNDVLGNRVVYVFKRMYLQQFKVKSFPTFSYDAWFRDYMIHKAPENTALLEHMYDMKEYERNLELLEHLSVEGYWHKFSNPIMLAAYTDKYK